MQTVQTTTPSPLVAASAASSRTAALAAPCAATSLVVVSATDELWTIGQGTAPDAAAAIQSLLTRDIPLVLTTHRSAAEVLALQRTLRVRHPFVCDRGGALHVPVGYFPQLTKIGTTHDGWNILEFRPPHDTGAAVRLLLSLYRLCSDELLIVGVGQSWEDRVLLREADVAVVLRTGTEDEARLLAATPSAYLTTAPGPAGWSEAILGYPTQ